MRRFLPLVAGLAVLAGCVPRPPSAPTPAPPVVAPPPPAPRTVDWRDLPQTPGTWTYARDAHGSVARFGVAGSTTLLSLRCDAAVRRVDMSLAGSSLAPLTIRTSSTARSLQVQPLDGTPPGTAPVLAAMLAAGDPILDAMGFSRGRFVVEQAGSATLAIPAWAEIERVTEDCRG